MENPPSLNPQINFCAQQHSSLSSSSSFVYYPQSQNPNPNSDPAYRTNGINAVIIQPPGVHPVLPVAVDTLSSHVSSGYESHQPVLPYTYSQTLASGSAATAPPAVYFQDSNAAITPYGLNHYAAVSFFFFSPFMALAVCAPPPTEK